MFFSSKAMSNTSRDDIAQEEGKNIYVGDHLQSASYQQQGQISHPMAAPATYTNYYYSHDQYNADPSQRPYGGVFPVNQWVNHMEGMSSNHMSLPAAVNPVCSGIDIPSSSNNIMNPLPYAMSMPPDPSLHPMIGSNYLPYAFLAGHDSTHPSPCPLNENITLAKCVLYVPIPDENPPKPNGCKTVFVGGLPEKITEEIIRKAFSLCGEIDVIKMSTKNFCHIRFKEEKYAERSLYLSGSHMKIENKDEPAYSRKIKVDYAACDQHHEDADECECARREAELLAIYRALCEQISSEASVPAVPPFSKVQNLSEEFQNRLTLSAAVNPVCSGLGFPSSSNNIMNPSSYAMSMPTDHPPYSMINNDYLPYPFLDGHDNTYPSPHFIKENIALTECVLYAPSPDANPPTFRERPNGCKTVFVGGLPEKITEEIIREAFSLFGEINVIRMSLKNFCHVRFTEEEYVEKSLYLSGFQMKIENKDEPAYSGKIHVDYAAARRDQVEYECARRAARRLPGVLKSRM